MHLRELAAVTYINTFVSDLPITTEAKYMLRSFLPVKCRVEHGFTINNYHGLIEQLVKNKYWGLLDTCYATGFDKLNPPDDLDHVYLDDKLRIDDVMYVSSPSGLQNPDFEIDHCCSNIYTDYWKLPVNEELRCQLMADDTIVPRTLLIRL